MTDAERVIWFAVRDRRLQGFKFRRQATLGPFIVDFLCDEVKLIVEIDGGQHTESADADRTGELIAMGYRMIRFWNNEVLTNRDGVLQTIHTHLLASPSPVPYGRGPG